MADKPLSPTLIEQIDRALRPRMVTLIREAVGTPAAASVPTAQNVQTHAYSLHSGTIPNDHAPQFLTTDGARTLTGNLPVAVGVTVDGVDISAHAADANAHHAKQHSIVDGANHTAGGGGQYQVLWQPDALGGLGWAASSSDVSADGAGVNTLLRATSGGATVKTFAATVQVTAPKVAATGDLLLSPAGLDVLADTNVAVGAANYVSQTTGWKVTYAGGADFRSVYTDEMHAKSFIADLEQALAGGQIVAKSVAVLYATFTAPAAGGTTTLTVRDLPSAIGMAVFVNGDMIRLRTFSRAGGSLSITDCWGTATLDTSYGVSGFDAATKTQRFTFTRSAGVIGGGNAPGGMAQGATVAPDAIVLDYGVSGNGIYEVNAVDGAYGANSPYAQVVTWTTHPATGSVVNARFGKLSGVGGGASEFGVYAGTGTTTAHQWIRAGTAGVVQNNVAATWYSSGVKFAEISGAVGMRIYADSTSWNGLKGFTFSDGSNIYGGLYSWLSSTDRSIGMRVQAAMSLGTVQNYLYATNTSVGNAQVIIQAAQAATSSGVSADAESTDGGNGAWATLWASNGSGTTTFFIRGNGTAEITGSLAVKAAIAAGDSTGLRLEDDGGNLGVFVEDGGDVGIGTDAPATKLHVLGGARVETNSQAFNLVGTNHVYMGWYPRGFATGRKAYAGFGSASATSFALANEDTGNLSVLTNGNSNQLVLLAGGNVGIGNATGGEKLHVSGLVYSQAFRATTDTGGSQTNGICYTGASQGVSTGTGTIKMGGSTPHSSDYWIKIYVGTTAVYLPGFSNIS